jgi:hypothetical protein
LENADTEWLVRSEAMRRRIWWIVAIVILVVLLAPVAWYLGSPLFINKTVDEPFPTTSAPAQRSSP